MASGIIWTPVATAIGAATGHPFSVRSAASITGGCINAAYCIDDGERSYFAKIAEAGAVSQLQAEADGLNELNAVSPVRTPRVITVGTEGQMAYLVLENLDLEPLSQQGELRLGEQLAAQHAIHADDFGWWKDNCIGSTSQINTRTHSWVQFWRDCRLGYQLELAERNGYATLRQSGERLMQELESFFAGYQPSPSLLHGDLWSGNAAACAGGQPVIFDPAVYYGDSEADLAMTELFGGFGSGFYQAYGSVRSLDAGYPTRKILYNLYHILNHLNLFGSGYLSKAQTMISRLLAELG